LPRELLVIRQRAARSGSAISPDELAEKILVKGHADGGIHSQFRKRDDFATGLDTSGGDDGVSSGSPKRREIVEIDAGESAFAIDIGAEKSGAEWLESRHDLMSVENDELAPAMSGDSSSIRVKRDDHASARHATDERAKKTKIYFVAIECGATDDDLRGADVRELLCARDRANATADADFHFVFVTRAFAKRCDESVVVAFIHGGIKVDDVQPGITAEFIELARDVGNGEFAMASVDELDGLTGLEIDAGDQHGNRTSIF
jgi:hypothetical protein